MLAGDPSLKEYISDKSELVCQPVTEITHFYHFFTVSDIYDLVLAHRLVLLIHTSIRNTLSTIPLMNQ